VVPRDLRLPDDATLEQRLQAMPPDGHGLTVLPFLAGERAPGWRGDRRGAVTGLSLDTDRSRSCAPRWRRRAASGARLPPAGAARRARAPDRRLRRCRDALARVDQMLADALGHPVTWSHEPETTSRGAALLALQALGALPDLAAVRAPLGETFEPDPARHARYRDALERQRALDEKGMIVPMDATSEIRVVADPSALAEIAAQEVLEIARAAVAARGRFTVALAAAPRRARRTSGSRSRRSPRRCRGTAPSSSSGTSGACRRITRIPTTVWRTRRCSRGCDPADRVFRIPGESADPDAIAADYARKLAEVWACGAVRCRGST